MTDQTISIFDLELQCPTTPQGILYIHKYSQPIPPCSNLFPHPTLPSSTTRQYLHTHYEHPLRRLARRPEATHLRVISVWNLPEAPAWYLKLLLANIVMYFLALYTLSLAARASYLGTKAESRGGQEAMTGDQKEEKEEKEEKETATVAIVPVVRRSPVPRHLLLLVGLVGGLSGAGTLALSILFPSSAHGLQVCAARDLSYRFALKIWQLCLLDVQQPPLLLVPEKKGGEGKEEEAELAEKGKKESESTALRPRPPLPLYSFRNRMRYAWKLCVELRYRSFDIAVQEAGRSAPPPRYAQQLEVLVPGIIFPMLYLVPMIEVQTFATIYSISLSMRFQYAVLHPFSPYPFFWYPFAAPSMSAFWRTHWHQCARPWLMRFGYRPALRLGRSVLGNESAARAVAVLATFSLSGVWHACLVTKFSNAPVRAAVGLWLVFVSQGLWVLLEQALWGPRLGKVWWQTLLSWAVLIESGALWVRYADLWFTRDSIWKYWFNVPEDFR